MSEAGSGSDVVSMKCKAEKKGFSIIHTGHTVFEAEFSMPLPCSLRRLLRFKWNEVLDYEWTRCRYTGCIREDRPLIKTPSTWSDSFSD